MTAPTHAVGAAATVLTLTAIIHPEGVTPETCALSCFIASLGSWWPDIDKPNSKIANSNIFLKILSWVLFLLFHHRTITHCLIAGSVLGFCSCTLHIMIPEIDMCNINLYIGYLSHLILDMLNPKGIPLFYPFSKKHYSFYNILIRFIPSNIPVLSFVLTKMLAIIKIRTRSFGELAFFILLIVYITLLIEHCVVLV